MSHCEFTSEADEDLIQIGDYIARDSVTNARHIRQRCVALADTPMIGIARPKLGAGLCSFPVRGTPYLIVYRPIADGVQILHIHHGRRILG